MDTSTALARTAGAPTFNSLLAAPDVSLATLRAHLAGLDSVERIRQCRQLSAKALGRLYQVADAGEPLTVEHMVEGVAAGQPVHWYGLNSLPLFRVFEKRFVKMGDMVVGYNEGATRILVGPGYYGCRIDPALPRELLIDYTITPKEKPAEWPTIRGNRGPISFLVYGNMYDYCRKVSDTVVIGHATKLGKRSLGQYFVLCRG
jgi:hypothetical protein